GQDKPEPPSDELIAEMHAFESRILSGDRSVLDPSSQMSARLTPRAGTITVNLRVTRDTARFYRTFESIMKRYLSRDESFLQLLCEVFWRAWGHMTEQKVENSHIYE